MDSFISTIQLAAVIFGLSVTMGLTTSTLPPTSNPDLMPNPCGGEIDMGYKPKESDLQESLDELLPNTFKIISNAEGLMKYMAAHRIQNAMIRSIAERTASRDYPSDMFPHPSTNFFSEDTFSVLYRNLSIVEMYFSRLSGVERSHDEDNDARIVDRMTKVTEAAQKMRCHLSVILRFYKVSVPTVEINVGEYKIDSSIRVERYVSCYKIFYMTKVFATSLPKKLKKYFF